MTLAALSGVGSLTRMLVSSYPFTGSMLARPDYIGTGRAHNCSSKIGVFCHPHKDTRRDNDHAASSRVGYIIILFLDSNFMLISSGLGP